MAIKNFKKVIQLNPNNALAYYRLGRIYSMIEVLDLCIENLSHAILLDRQYNELAKAEEDFKNFRENPKFQNLLNTH